MECLLRRRASARDVSYKAPNLTGDNTPYQPLVKYSQSNHKQDLPQLQEIANASFDWHSKIVVFVMHRKKVFILLYSFQKPRHVLIKLYINTSEFSCRAPRKQKKHSVRLVFSRYFPRQCSTTSESICP